MRIEVNKSLTAASDAIASQIREQLQVHDILCINIVSAPGSGKTSLIEQMINNLSEKKRIAVIEGDPHTSLDTQRIEERGITCIQVNTRGGCHLDAVMILDSIDKLDLQSIDLLIIENVGNLLCPSFWDLGEHLRVVMASLPEGADKPLKYPEIYSLAHVLIINKIDLEGVLRSTSSDIENTAHIINSKLRVFPLSCETREGMEQWCNWLLTRMSVTDA